MSELPGMNQLLPTTCQLAEWVESAPESPDTASKAAALIEHVAFMVSIHTAKVCLEATGSPLIAQMITEAEKA